MAVTSEDEPIVETPCSPGGIYASIDKLREIMGRCFDGEPLDGELADWLGEAIDGYLIRQFQTLEEALGLVFPAVAFRGGAKRQIERGMPLSAAWPKHFSANLIMPSRPGRSGWYVPATLQRHGVLIGIGAKCLGTMPAQKRNGSGAP
tara:strand:+ start:199 stop:642 length:444 start_codon:yes stop_codon:yes gene_type:complete